LEIKKMIRRIYRSFLTPRFVLRKISAIRSWNDLKFILRSGGRIIGHLRDFQAISKKKT